MNRLIVAMLAGVVGAAFAGCATAGSTAGEPTCAMIRTEHSAFGDSRGFPLRVDWRGFTSVTIRETQHRQFLDVVLASTGDVRVSVKAGTRGSFVVGGRIVTLATNKDAIAVPNARDQMVFTQWRLQFPLNTRMATRLASENLVAVRVPVGADEIELALKPKQSDQFREAVSCLNPTDDDG